MYNMAKDRREGYIEVDMIYDTLIIEGGGFKTAFTAGVTDAFLSTGFTSFDKYIGISGGSVAMSYFLSGQYRYCINAMKILDKDPEFSNLSRTFSKKGYLDIDYIATVASVKVPFKVDKAIKATKNKSVFIVATDRKKGLPEYIEPAKDTWIPAVVASSTLPFATKGIHKLNGRHYFDGGWSDPLPVKWAYENGSRNILLLRTVPEDYINKQSWADYFGSKYFKSKPKLAKTFDQAHVKYNDSLKFIANPPKGLKVIQIAPKRFLNSSTYKHTKKTLMSDYRYGVDKGLYHLNKIDYVR